MPSLERVGLAPLLVEEITRSLTPLLVAFTAFCALVQGFVLVQIEGVRSLQRDSRGQLLVAVLVMAVAFLLVNQLQPNAMRWLAFNYLVLAFCGALLVIQPVPVGEGPGALSAPRSSAWVQSPLKRLMLDRLRFGLGLRR